MDGWIQHTFKAAISNQQTTRNINACFEIINSTRLQSAFISILEVLTTSTVDGLKRTMLQGKNATAGICGKNCG